MPRYRKLHVKVVESFDVNDMPDDFTRLTWVLLPLALCREGRGLENFSWIKSKLYPLRSDVTQKMIADAIHFFMERDMIVLYEVNDRHYFYVPSFHKYQGVTTREKDSDYPAPPDAPAEKAETISEPNETKPQVNPEPIESSSQPTAEPIESSSGSVFNTQYSDSATDSDKTEDEKTVPALPSTFADWLKLIHESKNRPATLRFMHEHLFPGRDPPDYGYIGKTAKIVGGAGRLAELLWQASSKPPTGDVLRYVQGMAKGQRRDQEPVGLDALALLIQEEDEIGDT